MLEINNAFVVLGLFGGASAGIIIYIGVAMLLSRQRKYLHTAVNAAVHHAENKILRYITIESLISDGEVPSEENIEILSKEISTPKQLKAEDGEPLTVPHM